MIMPQEETEYITYRESDWPERQIKQHDREVALGLFIGCLISAALGALFGLLIS